MLEIINDYHDVFAVEGGERGETDWMEMEIDTGESHPIKQPPRRMPFAVCREVANQPGTMQDNGLLYHLIAHGLAQLSWLGKKME